jgi:hypothetical protein
LPNDPRNASIRAEYTIPVSGTTPLAWVPALVELQWLALGAALNQGETPDAPVASAKKRLGERFLG